MNKFILIISLLFLQHCFASPIETSFSLPSNETTSHQQKTKFNSVKAAATIATAIELIKNSPYIEIYDIISGKNPTRKPINIEYKNLESINPIYANFDALGWKKKKQLSIYINTKHYDAPPEAIAAIIAGRTPNTDEYVSINEEVYCWCIEGAFWTYFTLKNPELINYKQPIIERENFIKKLLEKGNYTETYVKEIVLSNKSYTKYKDWPASPGFSDEELNQKLSKLFKSFNFQQQTTVPDKFTQTLQDVKNSNFQEINWVPYMKKLEQDIKKNWAPNKNGISNSKQTTVMFIVNKNGTFSDLKILKTSGTKSTDEEALNAIQKTGQFEPLPNEFNGEAIPIEFTFALNVFQRNVLKEKKSSDEIRKNLKVICY